ncbi:ACT domain-containing protein ACR4-like protein [Tanacetum coccineum]
MDIKNIDRRRHKMTPFRPGESSSAGHKVCKLWSCTVEKKIDSIVRLTETTSVYSFITHIIIASNKARELKTMVSSGGTHTERRLHQMMLEDRDFERGSCSEYCITHVDGSHVKSEAERQRMVQCIEAAIEIRVSEGLKLEPCTTNKIGLLSDGARAC